jgi:hypothetical protein
MQQDDVRNDEARLAQYRWFLGRLHWIERQLEARPVPPGRQRPLNSAQLRRMYLHLKAEYHPE